jgi:hypothetical protein
MIAIAAVMVVTEAVYHHVGLKPMSLLVFFGHQPLGGQRGEEETASRRQNAQ